MAIDPAYLQIGWKDPSESFLQGVMGGLQTINNVNALKANQAEAERKQLIFDQEQARLKEMQAKRNEIITKGANIKDVQDFILAYPEFSKPYEPVLSNLAESDKRDLFLISRGAYNAIDNNQPEIAESEMERLAKAYENSGKKEWADATRQYAKNIRTNPKLVKYQLAGFSSILDPTATKAIGEEQRANEMQPYEIEESKSKTANNYSQITDRQEGRKLQKEEMYLNDDRYYAGLDQNEKQFWAKMNADERAAARAMAEKPETTTERLARLEKANGYAGAVAQAKDAAENAARLAKLADTNGGAYWDRLIANIPGTSENTFRKDVETLKSQVFLTQIEQMRGLGALTESEGAALKSSIASLDLNQGSTSFKNNLNKISLVLNRAAKKAEKNAEYYATKGKGYSEEVTQAAKQRGISPAEMQTIANELGW